MSKEKAFGIGCFHFGIKKTHPFRFKGFEYLDELKKTLSKIPNLNNLTIKTDDGFESWEENITEALPSLENDINYFPSAVFFNLEFDLYIPFRIQEEIIEEKKKFLDTYSEKFKITILHGFHAPVTIVEIKNPTKTPDPSTAVRLVREFLKKEMDGISEFIRFEYIGPSPFHVDFYLKPQKQDNKDNWLFNSHEIIDIGYYQFIINYNKNEFNSSDEALDFLKPAISNEFGYYYKCIQVRNYKMNSWESIQNNLEKLTQIQETSGMKGVYKRLFKRYFLIEKLITDLTTFEGEEVINKAIRRNEYLEVYPSKEEAFFKIFIDKELQEKIDYPIKQTTSLIKFIENRRAKNLELFIVIIAAIFGGLVGSLLTIYFQQI